ncbi:MAG: hypothetical protein ACXVGG_09770 [Mycobacteriaceae bacterium]
MSDDEDVVKEIQRRIQEMFPEGVSVPSGVSEDEAVQAVQDQFTVAGFDCPEEQARDLVRRWLVK